MMEKLQYKVEGFEGPLDLLLTLIAKHKMDIYTISISALLEQYMAQIVVMQNERMEVASEFLEMAARLVHIKSVSLLPKSDEAEALTLELTGQLIEYQLCKEAAVMFGELISFDRFVRLPEKLDIDPTYKGKHSPRELLSALMVTIGKGKSLQPPKEEAFSGIVSRRIVSVASQAVSILRLLWNKRRLPYDALFQGKQERSHRVAIFLALLELVKGRRIRIEGESGDSHVRLLDGGKKS